MSLNTTSIIPLLLVTDQTSLVGIALTVLHCVAGLDGDAVSLIEYTAPWARNSSAVLRALALTCTPNILQLVATAVVVVLVLGPS